MKFIFLLAMLLSIQFCYSVSSDKRINASATFAQRHNSKPRHRGRHDGKDGTKSTLDLHLLTLTDTG